MIRNTIYGSVITGGSPDMELVEDDSQIQYVPMNTNYAIVAETGTDNNWSIGVEFGPGNNSNGTLQIICSAFAVPTAYASVVALIVKNGQLSDGTSSLFGGSFAQGMAWLGIQWVSTGSLVTDTMRIKIKNISKG